MYINIILISIVNIKNKKILISLGIINTLLLMTIDIKTGMIIGEVTYLAGILFQIIINKQLSMISQIVYSTLTITAAFLLGQTLFEHLYNINLIKVYFLQPQLQYFVNSVSKYRIIFTQDIYTLLLDAFRYQAKIFVPSIIILASSLIGISIIYISQKLLNKDNRLDMSKLSVDIHGDSILIYGYLALIFFGTDFETVILLKNIIYIVTILYFIQGCYVFDFLTQTIELLSYRVALMMVFVTMIVLLPTVIIMTFPFTVFRVRELMEVLVTMIAILGIIDSKVNIRRLS